MRKILLLFLCFVLLTGCKEKTEEIKVNYDTTYYEVATPYKESIGSYSIRGYDKNEVENMLMNLSMQYFKTNNSLYQNGQYLTKEEMKELLNNENLNKVEPVKIDKVEIFPSYISAIYEQNYLSLNGSLKGISLAIILDCNQSYEINGNTYYKLINKETVLQTGQEKARELLQYMRTKDELKNVKIMIGIYVESNNYLKGGFQYVGVSDNDAINFDYVNYHYELLDGDYVIKNDMDTYNAFLSIKREFDNNYNLYIQAVGLYQNNILNSVQIQFNGNYISQSMILDISKKVSSNISSFGNVIVKVNIISNKEKKAFFIKKLNSNELETYLLEG